MKKNQLDLPEDMVPAVAPLTPIHSATSAAVAAVNASAGTTAGSAAKPEERRQNVPLFVQKPMQTIPVKLPDNVIELLKGQARQRGISLQTLIKTTLAASVSAPVAEEQS